MALTPDQRARYARNLLVPGIGEAGQERLGQARVLIVGLGGLGSPAALYLAAAGIGTLGLLDPDVVEPSNLQRQILHTTPREGWKKTDSAAAAIGALNPEVRLDLLPIRLTAENAGELLSNYDLVVEATDSFESKFLVNDQCLALEKPFSTAGILALSGHVLFVVPGRSPCLRCAFPETPTGEPTTAELGVLGAVPGVLGALEAMEAIRWIAGLWRPRPDGSGRLHSLDGEAMHVSTLPIPRRPSCRCAELWRDR